MRILLFFFFWAGATGFPQTFSQCRGPVDAFVPGEKLVYDIYYNWGVLWVKAGKVTFMADTIHWAGKPAWKWTAIGESLSSWDWFFKVRDRYETIASRPGLRPYRFYRNTHEGGYHVYNLYHYNYSNQTIVLQTQTSKRSYRSDTLAFTGCIHDLLSAAYYARTLDYSGMGKGQSIPVRIGVDEKIFDLPFVFRGTEVQTLRNGNPYPSLKFTANVVEGSVFKGREEVSVWVTNDSRHIPVKVEASIMVGSVKAFLNEEKSTLTGGTFQK